MSDFDVARWQGFKWSVIVDQVKAAMEVILFGQIQFIWGEGIKFPQVPPLSFTNGGIAMVSLLPDMFEGGYSISYTKNPCDIDFSRTPPVCRTLEPSFSQGYSGRVSLSIGIPFIGVIRTSWSLGTQESQSHTCFGGYSELKSESTSDSQYTEVSSNLLEATADGR